MLRGFPGIEILIRKPQARKLTNHLKRRLESILGVLHKSQVMPEKEVSGQVVWTEQMFNRETRIRGPWHSDQKHKCAITSKLDILMLARRIVAVTEVLNMVLRCTVQLTEIMHVGHNIWSSQGNIVLVEGSKT